MLYPNNLYFKLFTDPTNMKPLHSYCVCLHHLLSGDISNAKSWRCVLILLWAQVLWIVYEQNIKGDKQGILNYICLCQLTLKAFVIPSMLYIGIKKFTILSKFWVYSLPTSVTLPYFLVKKYSPLSLSPLPSLPFHWIIPFALGVY